MKKFPDVCGTPTAIRGAGLLRWILMGSIGVICLILIFRFPFYYNTFFKRQTNPKVPANQPVIPTAVSVPAATSPAQPSIANVRRRKEWGRDPFSEISPEARETSGTGNLSDNNNLSLTGIFHQNQRKTAILNHKLVREGDTIQDFQVVQIEKDRVILKQGEKEIIVRLGVPDEK